MNHHSFYKTFLFLGLCLLTSFSLLAATTWTGAVDSDWNNSANWSSGVPSNNEDVTIPVVITNYPIITSDIANTVKKITISGVLTISSGSLYASDHITTELGGLLLVNGGILSTLKSLDIDGVYTQTSGTMLVRDLTGSGTMTMNNGFLEVDHDFKPDTAESFNALGGTVKFTGSAGGQGFSDDGVYSFWNVQVNAGVDPNFDNNETNRLIIAGNLSIFDVIDLPNNPPLPGNVAGTLRLNAVGQANGTWGSTSSTATYQNDTYFTGTGILNVLINLPVDLLSFTGTDIKEGVLLEWATLSEWNNEKFVIQRSIDGKTFDNIQEQAGFGTSQSIKSYSYIDQRPISGSNFYRLKQVDYDGSFTLYDVIEVRWQAEKNRDVVIYPNPTSEKMFITSDSHLKQPLKVDIFNLEGMIVKSMNSTADQAIEVAHLISGTYIVKVHAEGKEWTKRLVIQ